VGPWKFCTGLPDGHRGSNPTYDTRACQHHSVLHLQELVFYGLGATNFLPEVHRHNMVWYTMVKTTRKKMKRCLCLCKKLSTEQEVSIRASGYIRENAVHTALQKKSETLSLSLQECVHRAGSIKRPPGYTRKCRAHCLAKKEIRFVSPSFFCTPSAAVLHPWPRRPRAAAGRPLNCVDTTE